MGAGHSRRVVGDGGSGADFSHTVSDNVEPKMGKADQTLGGFQPMACQDIELDPRTQDQGGKQGDGARVMRSALHCAREPGVRYGGLLGFGCAGVHDSPWREKNLSMVSTGSACAPPVPNRAGLATPESDNFNRSSVIVDSY